MGLVVLITALFKEYFIHPSARGRRGPSYL